VAALEAFDRRIEPRIEGGILRRARRQIAFRGEAPAEKLYHRPLVASAQLRGGGQAFPAPGRSQSVITGKREAQAIVIG